MWIISFILFLMCLPLCLFHNVSFHGILLGTVNLICIAYFKAHFRRTIKNQFILANFVLVTSLFQCLYIPLITCVFRHYLIICAVPPNCFNIDHHYDNENNNYILLLSKNIWRNPIHTIFKSSIILS